MGGHRSTTGAWSCALKNARNHSHRTGAPGEPGLVPISARAASSAELAGTEMSGATAYARESPAAPPVAKQQERHGQIESLPDGERPR